MRTTQLTGALLGACCFLASARASADPSDAPARRRPTWWVDVRPWTCAKWAAPLAGRIALACDAADDACTLASEESRATHRVVLRCDGEGESWTLEAYAKNGDLLWST